MDRRAGRVRAQPAGALDRRGRAEPERVRSAADDAGVSVLVAVDLHARPAGDLRADRLWPPDLEQELIGTGSCSRGSMRGVQERWPRFGCTACPGEVASGSAPIRI